MKPFRLTTQARPVAAILALLSIVCALRAAEASAAGDIIWFDRPAAYFTESSPLANGRLAAMVFGGTTDERIVLNEASMWSGSAKTDVRPTDVYKELPEINRLLLAGRVPEAERLLKEKFLTLPEKVEPVVVPRDHAPGTGSATFFGCYQVLGNLWLNFDLPDRTTITEYRRELNLATSMVRVTFRSGGVGFTRETVASVPDDILVLRLSADQPGKISFRARLDRPERANTIAAGTDGLLMTGQLQNGVDGRGSRFAARLRAVSKGGFTYTKDNALCVRGADEVLLYITGLTDARTFGGRRADDPPAATATEIERVRTRPYAQLCADQAADHARFYQRVSFRLGGGDIEAERRPTPERLEAFAKGANDPALVALLFNFGRYLLITTSRPGGLPPNLQGLWAEEIQTPWNGDWHLDGNLELNYWSANVCNLDELNEPLLKMIEAARISGTRTARQYYDADGWVIHVMTNPWSFTLPCWSAGWGIYQATPWLCQHVWDRYEFTRDRAYLERAYPILRDAARFYLATMVTEPKTGWLVSVPSHSPENSYFLSDGTRVHATIAATGQIQMIRHLFNGCIEATQVLGVDDDLREKLIAARTKLPPTRVAADDGRLMEWFEDYKDGVPQHRLLTHLFGAYPGVEINPESSPALVAAAKQTLAQSDAGRHATGEVIGPSWIVVWHLGIWARFKDPQRCRELINILLRPVPPDRTSQRSPSGLYPNLFAAVPPFQIESNLAAPAVIAEMLLQNYSGELNLLPALPRDWPEGAVSGLRARGGFEVDIAWTAGRLVSATIRRTVDDAGPCRVRYGVQAVSFDLPGRGKVKLDANLQTLSH